MPASAPVPPRNRHGERSAERPRMTHNPHPLEHVDSLLFLILIIALSHYISLPFVVVVAAMVRQLEQMQRERQQRTARLSTDRGGDRDRCSGPLPLPLPLPHPGESYQCVALHVSPDLGERLMLSGERALLDEVSSHLVTSGRSPLHIPRNNASVRRSKNFFWP